MFKNLLTSFLEKKNKNLSYLRAVIISLLCTVSFANSLFSQISTAVTMSGTPISGSPFATFGAAVTAVNGLTITGPVVMNLTAAQTETLAGKITMTATGTSTNTITIKKSGAGAKPKIIGYTGTNATPQITGDGMLVFAGTDYMTLDSVDFEENAANTTTTTQMKFAIAFAKQSATDGCQFNTVKNCSITLNRLNNTNWSGVGHTGSCGIVVLNTLHNAIGTVTVTAASGSNSFNKFQSNTIQNCNAGIVFVAFGATTGVGPNPNPATFLGDLGNEVGGSSTAGNSILNFGGGAAAANPSSGIFANHQWSMKVTHNIINNNNGSGVNHINILRGLFFNSSSTSASLSCTNNVITIKGGGTTFQVTGIESVFGGTAAGNRINITNNTINMEYLTATTGICDGIWHSSSADTVWITNNIINPFNYCTAVLTGSGAVNGIRNSGAATRVFIQNNQVLGINRTGTTGGTTIGIFCSSGTNQTVKNNLVRDLNISGTGTASTMYGIQTSTGTIVVDSNQVRNIRISKVSGTGALYGLYNFGVPSNENYNFNNIDSVLHLGTGTSTRTSGIYVNTTSGTRTISYNEFSNIISGSTTTAGIVSETSTPIIFNNRVRNVNLFSISTTATCAGIKVNSISAGPANIYNNFVSNITAPLSGNSNAVRGLDISATGVNANIYYNTVKLDTSGNNLTSIGTNFGGSGINLVSASDAYNIRNNYIAVKGTPNGTGSFSAIRRVGVTGSVNTAPSNITLASNVLHANSNTWNFLYVEGDVNPAGFANTTSLRNGYAASGVANDVTNNIVLDAGFNTSCGLFKQWKSCVNCFTENNLTATSPTGAFVPSSPSLAQNSAIAITTPNINFDHINASRGATPDMGALEFSGTAVDLSGPAITVIPIPDMLCTIQPSVSIDITDISGVAISSGRRPRIFYRKTTEPDSFVRANNTSAPGWKWVEATNASSPFTFTIDYSKFSGGVAVGDTIQYFAIAQDVVSPPNVTVNSAIFNPTSTCPDSVNLPVKAGLLGAVGTRKYIITGTPSMASLLTPNPLTSCIGDSISHLVVINATGSIPTGYCASNAGQSGDEDIDSVFFNSINNTSACASLTGSQGTATGTANTYSNFVTSGVPIPNLIAGSTYPLSVRINQCGGGGGWTHSSVVFFDWNRDGDFDDANEKFIIADGVDGTIVSAIATINITVPTNISGGSTRMRISNRESTAATAIGPCNTAGWGETEDYEVNLIPTLLGSTNTWTSNKTGTTILGTTNPFKHAPLDSPTIYRDSINYFGCPVIVFDTVNANPLPKRLRVFNTFQCGAGVPPITFKVRDSNGYTLPTIAWYSSALSTVPLQSSSDTVFTSTVASTTTMFVSVQSPAGCWSPRVPITLTVNTSDSILGRANGVRDTIRVCTGTPVNLTAINVQSPAITKSFDTFTWTSNDPNSGIGSPIKTTNGNHSFTPVIGGNYQLYVNAIDTGSGCSAVDTIKFSVQTNPFAGATKELVAAPNPVCIGNNVNHLFVMSNPSSVLPTGYCASAATSTSDEDIDSVSFGVIQNNTGCPSTLVGSQGTATGTADFYSDFTASTVPIPDVIAGNTYPFNLNMVSCGGAFTNSAEVYFDWNRDGDFGDSGEEILVWNNINNANINQSINITVPANATLGKTVMRISVRELAATAFSSCHNVANNWGETEDYVINIKAVPTGTTFSWTNNFTGPGTVIGTANPLIHALPAATTIYNLRLTNGVCIDSIKDTIRNNVPAIATTSIAGPTSACFGDQLRLSTNTSGACTPYSYNWFVVGGTGGTFTAVGSLNNDTILFNPTGATGARSVRVVVTDPFGAKDSSTQVISFNNPTPIAIIDDTVCGVQPGILRATASPATDILRWYASPTSFAPLAEGTTFTTPPVSANTKFYVRQFTSVLDSAGTLGTVTVANSTVPQGLRMNVNQRLIINSADILPFGPPNSTGTMTVELRDNFGTTLEMLTNIPFSYNTGGTAATTAATATPVTIPLGFLIPPGTGYDIVVTNVTGANFVHRDFVFPSPYPQASTSSSFSITAGINNFGVTNFQHFYLFNLRSEQGCWGGPVVDSVRFNNPPTLTLSRKSDSVCSGASTTPFGITSPSPASIYNTYTWSPSTNISGTIATGYVFSEPNPGNYTYIIIATQTAGQQCVNRDTFTLKVKNIPLPILKNPTTASVDICNGSIQSIEALSSNIVNGAKIGTGTTGSTLDATVVFNSRWHDQRTQHLYLASELTAAGFKAGKIDSVHYLVTSNSSNTATLPTINMSYKMAHTSATSLSGYINNVTFTNCYSNAAFPNPPNGSTVRFPFSNAFIWDGTSNVLVEICQDNTAFSGFIGFEATAQTNPMVFGTRQDNNTGLCVNNSASFNQTMRVNPTFFQFVKYPITWSPTTGLFTNAVASSAYTSGARDTVWSAHNDTIKYFMTATHPNSCAINDSIVLNVKDTVTINTQPPAFIAFCAGDTLKLSVAASSSSPMTYQWKKNGLNISTALNASAGTNMLIIPNCVQADSGGYEVEISTGAPCGPKSSITSTVKVRLPITITTQPNDNTVCVGSSFCLSAAAMNDSSRVWTQLTGANTGTNNTLCISSSAYADSGRYFITYIPQTPCPTKNSDTVRVRVLPPALIAADPASLTTLCIGDSVTLKATHTGALSFQWLKNGLPIGGAITDSLKVKATALTDSGEYRLVVYSPPGCTNDTTSVNTGVIKINLPVSIATQPLAKTFVCQNSPFNASVTASNTSGYQWEKDAVTIFAATNAAFNAITSTQPSDAGVYRVLVKGLAPCPDVNSTNDTLVVTTLAAITTPPTAFQVCEDQSISITGAASNAASYQWLRNGVAISPNGNVQTYTKGGSPATMADSGMYRLVALSNPAGATTCKADTSAAVLGAVVRKIQITTQPLANTFVCQNSAFNTSILAQNVTGYQWRKGASNVSIGTGGTTANYSITSTQPADAGVYSVLMTGNYPCPTVTSTNNTLAVTTLAAITTPPTAFQVCEDQSISITGAASNAASYQWLRNGVAISPNGNVQTYTKGGLPATMADSGRYRLIALSANAGATICKADTTPFPGVLGAVVRKIVVTTQPPVFSYGCLNANFSMNIAAQNVTGYSWRLNGNPIGQTTATMSRTSFVMADTGTYTVVMTGNSPCPSVTSNNAKVDPTTAAVISTEPQSTAVCLANTLTLTVAASAQQSYQWRKNGVNIVGQTGNSFTIPSVAYSDSATYDVIAVAFNGCTNDTSIGAVVKVSTPLAITAPLANTDVKCEGQNISYTTGASGTGPFTYTWTLNGSGIGTNTTTYSKTSVLVADSGRYIVNIQGSPACPAVRDTIDLDVNKAPVIVTQPNG
ncbi:MAG: GEVED domain-containing protein, partial [Chitinophagales bacterium]